MSTSANIIQLVRSHYSGDERAFASAAVAVARRAKIYSIRTQIENLVAAGAKSRTKQQQQRPNEFKSLQVLPPPASDKLYQLPQVTFAELLLQPEIQAMFDEVVEELEYREELEERGLRPRSRILLWGPPGNGKTASGAAIANAIGQQAWCVDITQLASMFMNQTGQNLGEVFRAIYGQVVVFDELDAIGSERGRTDSGAAKDQNSTVNVLLTMMDRHRGGVIIATTNRIDILDPALLRRFDEVIHLPQPTSEQKANLARRLCEGHRVPFVDCDDCTNFDGVTKRVLREARKHVMREIRAMEEQDGDEAQAAE